MGECFGSCQIIYTFGQPHRKFTKRSYSNAEPENRPSYLRCPIGLSIRQFCNKVLPRSPLSVQVRPNGLLIYTDRDPDQGDDDNLKAGREKLARTGYTGLMSPKAVGKVKKYVSNWVCALNAQAGNSFARLEAQAHRMRFVTLTLPATQQHSDQELKRVFSTWFLVLLKRRFEVENYVWRAETQKTGGLHFHLLIDRPIPALELRRIWNSCLEPYGYINRYRQNQERWHKDGFKVRPELFGQWNREAQLKAYRTGRDTDWSNPNTTDIHALRNVKNVLAYVVKYVSKNSGSRVVEGRLWGCSDGLRDLDRFTLTEDAGLLQLLTHEVENETVKLVSGDGWSFYTCDTRTMLELWFAGCSELFISHWRAQAEKLPGKPLQPCYQIPDPPSC